MTKFTVEVTATSLVKTLEYAGMKFINTWVPCDCGSKTLEKSFGHQVKEAFPNISEELLGLIDDLDSGDEDDIQELLQEIDEYED